MNEKIRLDCIFNGPRHAISETYAVCVDLQTVSVDRAVVNPSFDFLTLFWEGWWMAFGELLSPK